jgi:hypothetical protein
MMLEHFFRGEGIPHSLGLMNFFEYWRLPGLTAEENSDDFQV